MRTDSSSSIAPHQFGVDLLELERAAQDDIHDHVAQPIRRGDLMRRPGTRAAAHLFGPGLERAARRQAFMPAGRHRRAWSGSPAQVTVRAISGRNQTMTFSARPPSETESTPAASAQPAAGG